MSDNAASASQFIVAVADNATEIDSATKEAAVHGKDVASAGIDRTRNFSLKMTLAEFAHLFDGSERMISVETIVWYVREVFNP